MFQTVFFLFLSGSLCAQEKVDISGIWQMEGYGRIIKIDETMVTIYDHSSLTCLPSNQYPRTIFEANSSVIDNVLTVKVGISTYHLNKLSKLPELCTTQLSKQQKKDPFFNFDVLWNTFNDHYAYFKERGVDWKKSYTTYRNQITENTSEAALFAICYQMLDDLNEGHVDISAPDKIMKKAAKIANWSEDASPNMKELYKAIAQKYIPKRASHNFTRSVWGKINDKVGYLQVNSMSTQSYYGLTNEMSVKEASKQYLKEYGKSKNPFQDEVDGMHKTMKRVLKDVEGTEHFILDVRFNGGGYDPVAFAILEYFAPQSFTAFKKYARVGDSITSSYTYTLEPADILYTGKLHILQSHWSASAVETMLLASLQLDTVSYIGSPSAVGDRAIEHVLKEATKN